MSNFVGLMSGLWLVVSALSVPLILFSPMMFDAPGSEKNLGLIILFRSLVSFPLVTILSIVVAYALLYFNQKVPAGIVILMPLINISLFWSYIK